MSTPIASIIFTTYNQPDWLEKTLLGFAAQDRDDFEVIVADDGSRDETRERIEGLRPRLPYALQHIWQPDEGFQKCRILNKAIVASRSDYLIVTDGDCIPRRDFVSTHLRLREPGRFLSGGYFKLPMDISKAITGDDIARGDCFELGWLRRQGLRRGPRDIKLVARGGLAALLDVLVTATVSWNGHNASGWKRDIVAANGFDERMGYGGQDKEFGERLANAGIRGKRIRHRAICVHLDHSRGYSDPKIRERNRAIRAETLTTRATRTAYGIEQHA
ncbi:glycosyltransferase family 2 protein [Marilutibacter alkalisoli]|uniref:Glycosyltransferase n=1 Tax=Marilutibacter alkalisoli TaxID=2591633 RepID=A0A514BV51_9GAMM|nr:glycosyltransferase family 2 protein [Lysobacter alkalisoli]QDH71281.1 glycosyltransferase [Lysobacter alkalisoli]